MWEMILFAMATFLVGWEARRIIDRKANSIQQSGKPELMWFNDELSRWDRVTELQLRANGNIIARIPIEKVEEDESR